MAPVLTAALGCDRACVELELQGEPPCLHLRMGALRDMIRPRHFS